MLSQRKWWKNQQTLGQQAQTLPPNYGNFAARTQHLYVGNGGYSSNCKIVSAELLPLLEKYTLSFSKSVKSIFDMFRIITSKQQKFSQSDPYLICQFSKKVQSDPVLIRAHLWYCCDRKSRAAYAQSFALWQQATIEFTCHDHSINACSRHIYVWCCSSRTSRSWWITHLTQHHRRGCNTCMIAYTL